ncbi:MAG: hypothetical protein AAF368_04105, partial [Planctomycetota bacterium]
MIPTQPRSTARVAVLLAACVLPLMGVATSNAATIAVTTTADVIAVDGLCSLREAVTAANTNLPFSDCPTGEAVPAIDVIELAAGTYTLTLLPVDEDANLGGDLDLSEAVTVRGLGEDFIWWDDPATPDVGPLEVFNDPTGFPRTFTEADLPDVVVEMGIGDDATLGDGDRVFDIIDLPPGPPDGEAGDIFQYTFENLGIVGGDAFCEVTPPDKFCQPGAGGINFSSTNALDLRRIALFENSASCAGPACGSSDNGAALLVNFSSDLRVIESVVASNIASCAEEECRIGSIVSHEIGFTDLIRSEMSHSLIAENLASCSAQECSAGDVINLEGTAQLILQTAVTGNEMDCSGLFSCNAGGVMKLGLSNLPSCVGDACLRRVEDVEISENRITCDGSGCRTSEMLNAFAAVDQTFERIRFAQNAQQCADTICDLDAALLVRALATEPGASLELRTLEFTDNTNQCTALACSVDNILRVFGEGIATLTDISITGEARCTGNGGCTVRSPVQLDRPASVQGLSVTGTEVSCSGLGFGFCDIDSLVQVSATDADTPTLGGLVLTNNDVSCPSSDIFCRFSGGSDRVGEGGILALTTGSVQAPRATIDQATITGNTTSARGTLASNLDLEIVDSTISMNASSSNGGAIFNGWGPDAQMPNGVAPGILTLRGTTLEGNQANRGGGLFNPEGAILRLIGGGINSNA